MQEITAVNAILALLEVLIPRITDLAKAGQITAEQQATVKAKYDALVAAGNAAFTGPEWDVNKP